MNKNVENCPQLRRLVGVKDFNQLICCHLCKGYLIDATTLIECLHSFCKTCIISHLESNSPKSRFCPRCDNQIHKTKPKLNIRSDPTFQDIVYKLVPGLYKNEMNRRKEFYSKEPESAIGLSNEEKGEMSGERLIFTPEDRICLSIEYFPQEISYALLPFSKNLSNGALNCVETSTITNGISTRNDSQRRYLRCEGGMRVVHLKKWLKLKYDVRDHNDVEVLYKHDPLLDDYTMMDLAYIYSWRRNGPLCLYYKIIEPQKCNNEDIRLFKAPAVVAKRRQTVKHRHKQQKKRKFIDESNLITTNPVNEPLPPVDTALNTIGANLELMTNAVNNALNANNLKKRVNHKKKAKNSVNKTKSQLTNSVPKPTNNNNLNNSVDLMPTQTTGAKSSQKLAANTNSVEMNGLKKKSNIDNTFNNSINNGIKKSVNNLNTNKQIIDSKIENSVETNGDSKLKLHLNSSQTTKLNSNINQNNNKLVDYNKNKMTVVSNVLNALNLMHKSVQKPNKSQPKSPVISPFMSCNAVSSPMPSQFDIFQFTNSSPPPLSPYGLSSSKQMPKTTLSSDNTKSDNNCNDIEVALNLSTSKDKTT